MANTDLFLALPKYATGASVISSATAWAYGSYVVIAECLARDIYIIGVQFQITDAPASLDVTEEHLFEIATGAAGAEVTKIQIPYSVRQDTAVGYYLTASVSCTFPEGYKVPALSRISARATNSIAVAVTYPFKIFYQGIGEITRARQVTNNYRYVKVGTGMSTGERVR